MEDGEQRDGSVAEHASGIWNEYPCVEARSCIGVGHSRGVRDAL